MRTFAVLITLFSFSVVGRDSAGDDNGVFTPLIQAHAHNDYEHPRPLLDALAQGFCSVEADIHLVDGELLVAHDRPDVNPERTLESLYLEPLKQRVSKNDGRVYAQGPEFLLLIDIKTDGPATYRVLDETLSRYGEMLTHVDEAEVKSGPITAIISGNRPWDLVKNDMSRYVGIDGRLSDLESQESSHLLPLISDNWGLHFRWRGEGPMPTDEKQKLARIVSQAHSHGRKVRFWATPENPQVWRELAGAGVDLINTDKLVELKEFLLKSKNSLK